MILNEQEITEPNYEYSNHTHHTTDSGLIKYRPIRDDVYGVLDTA